MPEISVLLVESPGHRELTLLALEECCGPARIAAVADGAEALDFLFGRGAHADRAIHRQPRLVILDMQLPGMNGLEVLRAVRAHPTTQALPVVMLTDGADRQELDSAYEAGANSVVRKSTDADELRRKMRAVYEFWVTVNEADRNTRV